MVTINLAVRASSTLSTVSPVHTLEGSEHVPKVNVAPGAMRT